MDNRIHVSIILVLIAVALAACGGNGDQPGATGTVQNAFTAYQQNNRATLARLFCDPTLATLAFPAANTPRFSFSDLTFTEQDAAASRVQVQVSGMVRTGQSAANAASSFQWTLDLQQYGSGWCIAAIAQTPDS